MTFKFKDWIFNQLPESLREIDSNKDPNDQGTLQRFLQNMGTELDDEVVDFISEFTEILDIDTIPDNLLQYLGFTLGSPPSIDGTYDTYRKLLSYIVSIYKIKGTVCCYNLLFNLLGLGAVIYEYQKQTTNKYDTELIYDDEVLYDIPCEPCNLYDILYYNLLDDCQVPTINPVTQAVLDSLVNIICFIQPIDAKLVNLSQLVKFCEDAQIDGNNDVDVTLESIMAYDGGFEYDTGLAYDLPVVDSINNYTF